MTSTDVVPVELSVKNVPIFRPASINLIAFSCIPLQMTTETPLSSAQVAACT